MIQNWPWLAVVVGFLLVPAAVLLICRFSSKWTALAAVFFLANALFASWYQLPWSILSFWLLATVGALCVAAIVFGLWKLKKASWQRPGWMRAIASVILAALGLYYLVLNIQSVGARAAPQGAIDLQMPLEDGRFAVSQGGSGPPLQVGHSGPPSQRYAIDLVKLNGSLSSYRSYLQTGDYTKSELWNAEVRSPCTGHVVWARDGIEDSIDFDKERPAGNVVGISCKDVIVMLAHLREGSVAVEEGDDVVAGQSIGQIGMSGRTFSPHLHMHAERGQLKKDFSDNPGVPITLDGTFPYTGRILQY